MRAALLDISATAFLSAGRVQAQGYIHHPKGVCRPEASDAPSQPEGLDEVSQQDDRRQNVQRRYGEEGTEALVVLVDSKPAVAEIAEDGGRTGALGSPPPTEPREADVVSITAPNDSYSH